MVNINQDQILRIQILEQEVNQLNEQLRLIEQNVSEMKNISTSFDCIKVGEELFLNLGKRIYAPVSVKENKLLVDVGKGCYVKKSVADTKGIVDNQMIKINDFREQIVERLNELQVEMEKIINEINVNENKRK